MASHLWFPVPGKNDTSTPEVIGRLNDVRSLEDQPEPRWECHPGFNCEREPDGVWRQGDDAMLMSPGAGFSNSDDYCDVLDAEDTLIARIDGDIETDEDNEIVELEERPSDDGYDDWDADEFGDQRSTYYAPVRPNLTAVSDVLPTEWDEDSECSGGMRRTSGAESFEMFEARQGSGDSWHANTRARRQFARHFESSQRSATETIRADRATDQDIEFSEVEERIEALENALEDVDVWAPGFPKPRVDEVQEQASWEAEIRDLMARLHQAELADCNDDGDGTNVPTVIGSRRAMWVGLDGASRTIRDGKNKGVDTSWKSTTKAPRQWAARAA